ncbi:hypothetical protein ABMA28_000034 [Loxostege sticticalis]|uniref:Uncharacterized protein n=1 Tax=Loxostege sticticalis TaxID=481309 RepID=A0ABD0TQT0_LOXSC
MSSTEAISTEVIAAEAFSSSPKGQGATLVLRLITLILLVALLTCHIRSLRVFRWEQSVSGGVLVTYVVAMLGIVLGAGLQHGGAKAFTAYICATGMILLFVNAAAILQRWRTGALTRALAELLGVVGVPLRRQVYIKVALSAAAATTLFIDLVLAAILMSK